MTQMKKDPNTYPAGLDRKKVQKIIDFYDNQSEEGAIAEADAAWENSRMTLIRVPNELADEVRALIASRAHSSKPAARPKPNKAAMTPRTIMSGTFGSAARTRNSR